MRTVPATGWALLRCCHPEPTAAVTLVMGALAVAAGHTAGGALLVTGAVLTGQLAIGWLNDLLDARRDVAAGRTDKPLAAGEIAPRTVGAATVLAVVACVLLSFAAAGPVGGALHLVAVAAGLAYDAGLKSTRLSLLPYLVCFALLPVFVLVALPGAAVPWWLPVAGGLLGGGAHFANVLPDLDDDAATGVRGLPHVLGAAASRIAAAVLLLGATTVIAAAAPVPVGVAVAAPLIGLAALLTGFRLGGRAPFRAVLLVAVLAVLLLLTAAPTLTP